MPRHSTTGYTSSRRRDGTFAIVRYMGERIGRVEDGMAWYEPLEVKHLLKSAYTICQQNTPKEIKRQRDLELRNGIKWICRMHDKERGI